MTTAAAALILASCAATTFHKAPAQSYRLKGSDQPLVIEGIIKRVTNFSSDHTLRVTLNGEIAIQGAIGAGTADVTGDYHGKPALALCNRQQVSQHVYNINCRIIVDGEFASTLTF